MKKKTVETRTVIKLIIIKLRQFIYRYYYTIPVAVLSPVDLTNESLNKNKKIHVNNKIK